MAFNKERFNQRILEDFELECKCSAKVICESNRSVDDKIRRFGNDMLKTKSHFVEVLIILQFSMDGEEYNYEETRDKMAEIIQSYKDKIKNGEYDSTGQDTKEG